VDLQAVKASLGRRTQSLQKTLADKRKDLHKDLDLMSQVEAQTMKAEIRMNQERMEAEIAVTRRKFQTQLKEV
jgi:hypothetical protein